MDKSYDETIDKIYYYRLVATQIQKNRKLANLHPWDHIEAVYKGEPKYKLDIEEAQSYINKITRIKLYESSLLSNDKTIFYSNYIEDIGITIEFIKL